MRRRRPSGRRRCKPSTRCQLSDAALGVGSPAEVSNSRLGERPLRAAPVPGGPQSFVQLTGSIAPKMSWSSPPPLPQLSPLYGASLRASGTSRAMRARHRGRSGTAARRSRRRTRRPRSRVDRHPRYDFPVVRPRGVREQGPDCRSWCRVGERDPVVVTLERDRPVGEHLLLRLVRHGRDHPQRRERRAVGRHRGVGSDDVGQAAVRPRRSPGLGCRGCCRSAAARCSRRRCGCPARRPSAGRRRRRRH